MQNYLSFLLETHIKSNFYKKINIYKISINKNNIRFSLIYKNKKYLKNK